MSFNTGAALLDAIVLAVVGREETGTYGYRITQDVRAVLDISGLPAVSRFAPLAKGRLSDRPR